MTLEDFEIYEGKHPDVYNAIWVKVIAIIKNNKTGEIRSCPDFDFWDEDTSTPYCFHYEMGNDCDCTKGRLFNNHNYKCGDTRFSRNMACPKTGEIYYREFS